MNLFSLPERSVEKVRKMVCSNLQSCRYGLTSALDLDVGEGVCDRLDPWPESWQDRGERDRSVARQDRRGRSRMDRGALGEEEPGGYSW